MTFEAKVPLYGGYTLSRAEGVVFLRGTIPGEVVEAKVVQKRKDYSVAVVTNVLEPSPDRVQPQCSIYGICGGCHYQHISYQRQLRIKEEVLIDCLRRIGKIEVSLDAPIYDRPFHYRKRVQLKVSKDGRVGFYRPLSHEVVEFKECLLLEPELNHTIKRLKEVGIPEGVREIHLGAGDIVVASVKGEDFKREDIITRFREAGIGGLSISGRVLYGERRTCLYLNDYLYFVSPGTFFQSNWSLNRALTSIITKFVLSIKPSRMIDFYAGAGNFSIPVAGSVKEVFAVEENPLSCEDGVFNCEMNSIENVRFYNKKTEDFREAKKTDLLIVDPPRVGISKRTLEKIKNLTPSWIVYLSCNPSTFARDLSRLQEFYQIESVRLVDMFCQTYHIEAVGILKRREDS
jgi:23S rRNA (uracil1939-C5)-methyltransferase